MSKVNVYDIKVGDLVEYQSPIFEDTTPLGYVVEVCNDNVYAYWSDEKPSVIDYVEKEYLTGHWKVINFEEEAKVDELKVYTGKETIEALLEGKTLISKESKVKYKIENNKLISDLEDGDGFTDSFLHANNFVFNEFTEVATPQVGDWVKVTIETGYVHIGKLIDVDSGGATAIWNNDTERGYLGFCFEKRTWEILSPEQIAEYKREQVFTRVGRKLNEFKPNDVIEVVNPYSKKVNLIVHSVDDFKVWLKYHIVDTDPTTWYHSKSLTPVYFAESKVGM